MYSSSFAYLADVYYQASFPIPFSFLELALSIKNSIISLWPLYLLIGRTKSHLGIRVLENDKLGMYMSPKELREIACQSLARIIVITWKPKFHLILLSCWIFIHWICFPQYHVFCVKMLSNAQLSHTCYHLKATWINSSLAEIISLSFESD